MNFSQNNKQCQTLVAPIIASILPLECDHFRFSTGRLLVGGSHHHTARSAAQPWFLPRLVKATWQHHPELITNWFKRLVRVFRGVVWSTSTSNGGSCKYDVHMMLFFSQPETGWWFNTLAQSLGDHESQSHQQ